MSKLKLTVQYEVIAPTADQIVAYLQRTGWDIGEKKHFEGWKDTWWRAYCEKQETSSGWAWVFVYNAPGANDETLNTLLAVERIADTEDRSQMQVYIDIMRPYPLDAEPAIALDGHARFISYLMMHRSWYDQWLSSFSAVMVNIASWRETPSLVAAKRQAVEILNKFEQDKTYPKNLP